MKINLRSIEECLKEYRYIRYTALFLLSIAMLYHLTTPRPYLEQLKIDYIECITHPVSQNLGNYTKVSTEHCEVIKDIIRQQEPAFMLTDNEVKQIINKDQQKIQLERQTQKCRELFLQHQYSNYTSVNAEFEPECSYSDQNIVIFSYWDVGEKCFCGVRLFRDFKDILGPYKQHDFWSELETSIDSESNTIFLGNNKGKIQVVEIAPVRDASCRYGWDPINFKD